METIKVAAELEKAYRKTKKSIWLDLAGRLKKPRRQRAEVNLWKINKLAKILGSKTIVVPGKVLGFGELQNKATVIALEFSGKAEEKINANGKALSFQEALEKKINPKEMVIVK